MRRSCSDTPDSACTAADDEEPGRGEGAARRVVILLSSCPASRPPDRRTHAARHVRRDIPKARPRGSRLLRARTSYVNPRRPRLAESHARGRELRLAREARERGPAGGRASRASGHTVSKRNKSPRCIPLAYSVYPPCIFRSENTPERAFDPDDPARAASESQCIRNSPRTALP